jgi:hypothetical protein
MLFLPFTLGVQALDQNTEQSVKTFVAFQRQSKATGQLQIHKPMQGAAQHPNGVYGIITIETVRRQHSDNHINDFFAEDSHLGVAAWGATQCGCIHTRMRVSEFTICDRNCDNGLITGFAYRRAAQLVGCLP